MFIADQANTWRLLIQEQHRGSGARGQEPQPRTTTVDRIEHSGHQRRKVGVPRCVKDGLEAHQQQTHFAGEGSAKLHPK